MEDFIGILDSGVGGVSVLRTAVRLLPNESFIYYGDNRNAPYGPRSLDDIRALSRAAVDHLLKYDVKALVIACNTITSAYAEILRSEVQLPVIGMEPAIKPASLARSSGKVLALATRATLQLDKFSKLMESYGEGVIPIEGAGLVELVEAGKSDSDEAHDALAKLFAPYMDANIDAIVLGCTHYPFLRSQIKRFFPSAQIFDGREGTVRQLMRRLDETGSRSGASGAGTLRFESSGGTEKVELMKKLFLQP